MISFQDHPKAILLSLGSNVSSVRFQINMKEVIVSMQSIILILTFELFLTSNATESSCESRNVSNCNEENNVAVESNLNNSFRPLSLWFQMISNPSFECKEQEPVKIEGVIIFSMRLLWLNRIMNLFLFLRDIDSPTFFLFLVTNVAQFPIFEVRKCSDDKMLRWDYSIQVIYIVNHCIWYLFKSIYISTISI